MRVMFIEPPKDWWFVMGEYLPPPLGILQLAAYLEAVDPEVEISVVDCQAEQLGWSHLEQRLASEQPDLVAPSALATCNCYTGVRTVELAKKAVPECTTVVGGQHFSTLAQESLLQYPEIDLVVRGEGEHTLAAVVQALRGQRSLSEVPGITFRANGTIHETPNRPLVESLDALPMPGYHFVADHMKKYHFTMMAGKDTPYALIEGSRGCSYRCGFCSQWTYWQGCFRAKSPQRIADEMEYCFREFGSRFLWLTDDNFGLGPRTRELCRELRQRGIADEITWFMQARSDDIVRHAELLPELRAAGNMWILTGIESNSATTLRALNKGIDPGQAGTALQLLKDNDIFAQATLIIGERNDSHESLRVFRQWINEIDPDIAIFMILTPFPGTPLYAQATQENWIQDQNWAHYDMVHAIMPTKTMTRQEVQEELYRCYRGFFGSMRRRITGVFSTNRFKRMTYRYMMRQSVLKGLRGLL